MLGSDLGFLELLCFRIHGLTNEMHGVRVRVRVRVRIHRARFDKRDARGTQSKAQANGYTAALDCGFRVN
jgi:hypothetical protein